MNQRATLNEAKELVERIRPLLAGRFSRYPGRRAGGTDGDLDCRAHRRVQRDKDRPDAGRLIRAQVLAIRKLLPLAHEMIHGTQDQGDI